MSDRSCPSPTSIPSKAPEKGRQTLEPRAQGFRDFAKRCLLDPETMAERHSPGMWEALKREEREIAEALVKLPARIRELTERHDQVAYEHSAIEKHRSALEREYQRRSRTIVQVILGAQFLLSWITHDVNCNPTQPISSRLKIPRKRSMLLTSEPANAVDRARAAHEH